MKKILLIFFLCMLIAITLISCDNKDSDNDLNDDSIGDIANDGRSKLTLTTNISSAGTVSGSGRFNYNDNIKLNAIPNTGYYFLGWYYGTDLLSTSKEYNCKMWDKDVIIEAKFVALPQDYSEYNPDTLVNKTVTLKIISATPTLGKINVNDGGNKDNYTLSNTPGTTTKLLAFTSSSKQFLGWFDEQDNLIMSNAVFEFATPAFDYTIKAKWSCDNHRFEYNTSSKKYICSNCGADGGDASANNGFVVIDVKDKGKTLIEYTGNGGTVTIPSNVEVIANTAFSTKNSLIKNIIVPNNVNEIEMGAFLGCTNLESISLPFVGATKDGTSNTYFGYIFGASLPSNYYGPSNLKTVIITGVTSIGDWAFCNCNSLTNVTIGSGVTSIGSSAFSNCDSLTSVVIPNSVTSIGSFAFYDCGLTSINIPDSVTSIGSSAFSNCDSLTSVNIPDSVTSIDERAFFDCGLTSVTIGSGVTSIGSEAFYWCDKLVEVINKSTLNITKGSSGNGYVGSYAFYVYNGESKIVNKDGHLFITYNSVNYLLGYTGTDTALTLPNDYNGQSYEIYKRAFYNNDKITSVVIPNSVTSIGSFAFYSCTILTSVTIGSGVTSIGSDAFRYCTSLTRIVIPNSVTSIGTHVFSNCDSLTSITFADTSTWYRTLSESQTGGTQTSLTTSSTNATYFKDKYDNYYWYKK